ncbi:hypothetical protein Vadar_014550 [Vaccinium darrowii]|uniref:Uncharacterized protein n=1 Tax=Vaccinium darrowii TaxID=229202 RepID=A0ACB7X9R0_9ERIC|nr:hypothetical protein Vadar_014550 [Vaccinium darrowii]
MHVGGNIEGRNYIGGTFGFVDYCHEDELGIFELCHMGSQMGKSFTNDYYLNVHGQMRLIKSDAEVVRMCQFVDTNREVVVYAVSNAVDVIATQESQVGKGKGNDKDEVYVQMDEQGEDSDTDDYDPDSESSDCEDEEFEESDDGVEADDVLFQVNVNNEAEFDGIEHNNDPNDNGKDDMLDSEGIDNTEELLSHSSSLDSDDDTVRTTKKKKYPIFNENVDMLNPVFSIEMEFKTHAIFRDAIKEHSIKMGKKIKFKKSDTKNVQAVCQGRKGKKGCPWFIYGAFVKGDGVFRVKHYIDNHTCSRSYNVPWVSTNWIVKRYSDRIAINPTWPIQSLVDTIEKE